MFSSNLKNNQNINFKWNNQATSFSIKIKLKIIPILTRWVVLMYSVICIIIHPTRSQPNLVYTLCLYIPFRDVKGKRFA